MKVKVYESLGGPDCVYEKLGGQPALEKFVDGFYNLMATDLGKTVPGSHPTPLLHPKRFIVYCTFDCLWHTLNWLAILVEMLHNIYI